MLRPLNDRVLIQPHKSPDETLSGLLLPENRADQYQEMQGTVIAVGTCAHPLKHEAETLADKLRMHSGWDTTSGDLCAHAAELLLDVTRREPAVKVGDDVLFSWNVGQKVTIDDQEFLLMRESDLLAVLESV